MGFEQITIPKSTDDFKMVRMSIHGNHQPRDAAGGLVDLRPILA